MIQDIAPHVYDNAFLRRRPPQAEDRVLPVQEEKLFVRKQENRMSFLSVQEVLRAIGAGDQAEEGDEQTEPRGGRLSDEADGTYLREGIPFLFLFMIDDTACFGIDEPGILEKLSSAFQDGSWENTGFLRTAEPPEAAFSGITAMQLARWRADRKFCGACGAKMRPSRTERAFVCPDCGAVVYPKISPAVIVAVTHGDRILLTKYAGRSYARYALVAGFTEVGETIEDTVRREVMEEVGVKVKNLRFYKSQPWSFSDSLLMGFYCDLDGADETITLDTTELAVGEWVRREDMPERAGDISLTSEMMEQFRLGREPRRE